MELELGLALPDHPISFFDLNCDDPKETRILTTKRPFYEALEDTRSSTPTLPLLWTPHPRKDDDDDDDDDEIPADSSYARPNEKSVVGWPPVKSWRKRHCAGGAAAPYKQGAAAQSLYVKVKMDGAAIGRKIDLSNCDSYQTLTSTLSRMFGIDETRAMGGTHTRYTLTYQDKEGDWLLVGDATWETFIESVHRLKIRKEGQ